jgi:hypothetical protein
LEFLVEAAQVEPLASLSHYDDIDGAQLGDIGGSAELHGDFELCHDAF